MKQKKLTFQNKRGEEIVGVLYTPEEETKVCVIFCHGYRSTKESSRVKPMAESLAKNGIALFAFDFSGRGESQGKFESSTITKYIDDLSNAINNISKKYKSICVWGGSLGGFVALNTAIKDKRINLLVLHAPVSLFPWKKKGDFDPKSIAQWKKDGFIYTHSERFGEMKIDYSFYEDGLKYGKHKDYEKITVPVLIIHGTDDASVPLEQSEELIKHLKKNRLEVLKGADHTFSKSTDTKEAIELTTSFVRKMLK